MSAQNISRRSFLQKVGAGGAALTAAWLLDGQASPAYASGGESGPGWGILIDLTRCDGCNSCALGCKENWNLPRADVVPEALDSDVYTFVETRQVITANGQELTRYVKRQCMHCLNAACVSACPAAAMYKSAEGAVRYRSERCLGCRYCQVACPFGVPRFDWDNGVNPVISKCQMCYNLLQQGQEPACVQACPTGALRFGRRQGLLVQARAQIVSNPGRYVDHVFGELEVGGTAMLYLADVPFEQLGFPANLSHTAPPEETEKIMSKLPFVLGGMLALTAGTATYTHHRESLESAEEQGE
jgi:formate dehydrogenase iron-sulfur subunit